MAMRLYKLHDLMEEGGLVESAEILRRSFGVKLAEKGESRGKSKSVAGQNRNNNKGVVNPGPANQCLSEETIYTRAVKDRSSSSSEEINTSDECIAPEIDNTVNNRLVTSNVVRQQGGFGRNSRINLFPDVRNRSPRGGDPDGPSTSGQQVVDPEPLTPQEKAEQLIKDAERAKAKILSTPGNLDPIDLSKEFVHSVMVDESYSVIAAHVDEATYDKIIQGRYVDFSKLISKDKIAEEEEDLLQLVRKNGMTYYAPVKDGTVINSFSKWEQAFRVFSTIYTQEFPHRSSQLIQYNHVIHDIAQSYIWSNVYAYDKDFRIHLSKNPQRSWAIILQQSWSMRLKDQIVNDYGKRGMVLSDWMDRVRISEPCRRFNRGKCTYGSNCKYDHKCSYCFKFGHNVHVCRKASADRADKSRNGGHNRTDHRREHSPPMGGNEQNDRDERRSK